MKQVAILEEARNFIIMEEKQTDELGRIVLTEQMKNALYNAERSFEKGQCLNKDMFHQRFSKWLK